MVGESISTLFKENAIDVQSVDADNSDLDVDAATDVAARFFNDLPLRVSFAKAAYIESEANLAQRLEGAENFTNAAMVRGQFGTNRSEDDENDDSASMAIVRSAIDDLTKKREREREEWSRTTSTVGGVTMTGANWAALSQLMKSDEEFRQKLLDAFMARGMTMSEAEEHYDRVADVAAIAAIPPAQRTEDQNRTIREANADPAFKQDMAEVSSFMTRQPGAGNDAGLTSEFEHAASNGPQNAALPSNQPVVDRQVTVAQGFGL